MNVKSYSKTKNNSSNGYSGSSSGSVTKSTVAESATKLATTHTFWGNEFNGTQDVEGDLKIKDSSKLIVNGESTLNTLVTNSTADVKGTLTAENGITDKGDLVVNGTTTLKEVTVDGSINVNGKTYLQGTEITGAATISGGLSVTGASTLKGTVNCLGTLQSNNIDTRELSVTGKSIFNGQTTINNNLAVTGKTIMKDLEVTGEAHFYNMIIDEVKSVGGTIVISCANAEVQKVGKKLKYDTQGGYERLYLTYHYQDGTEIPNARSSTECYYIGLNRGSLLTDIDGWKTIFNNIFTKCSGTIDNDGNVTFTNGVSTTESLNSGKDTILIGLASSEQMILDNYSTLKEGIEYAASVKTKVVSYVNSSLKNTLINIKEFLDTKTLNYVTTTRCLWKKGTSNQFIRGDQVLCHKFSVNDTSKHYWTPVINTGTEEIDGTIYEFIDLLDGFSLNGTVYKAINGYMVNCEEGDNLVQLGYAASGTTYRSNAIIISSYAEYIIDEKMPLDEALQPPYFAQYTGINDYALVGHAFNYFSRNKDSISIAVKGLRGDIKKTGIDLQEGTITINTNNFYLKNQNGEKVLDADSEGNLEIKGVIKPLNLQMATKTFSIYATADKNMKTEDIKLVYLQNTESNSIYKITIESSSTINFEQYRHNVCTLTSDKAYNAKLTIDGVEKLNSALEADRVSDTAQTTNCETQHPQESGYCSISGTKFVFEGTIDDSKGKTYGLAYFYATFTDDNYRYHCILNINNQGIASFTKTKTPIYGGDSTSWDSVTSNIDMTNLKVGYKSFAQVSGNYRVFGEIDNEFYANNSQEYYYYELGNYCSGIYDCTKRVNGVEFGSYDATGKWTTTVNDSKEIAVIYVLPSPSSYIYNEKYRGLEITFICSNYTNAYLAVDGSSSNSVLYVYSNGDWLKPKALSNYNKNLSNLYKLQPGFNRVLCSYNAVWYVENI